MESKLSLHDRGWEPKKLYEVVTPHLAFWEIFLHYTFQALVYLYKNFSHVMAIAQAADCFQVLKWKMRSDLAYNPSNLSLKVQAWPSSRSLLLPPSCWYARDVNPVYTWCRWRAANAVLPPLLRAQDREEIAPHVWTGSLRTLLSHTGTSASDIPRPGRSKHGLVTSTCCTALSFSLSLAGALKQHHSSCPKKHQAFNSRVGPKPDLSCTVLSFPKKHAKFPKLSQNYFSVTLCFLLFFLFSQNYCLFYTYVFKKKFV